MLDYYDLINAIKHKILILIETNTYPLDDQNLLIQAIKSLARIKDGSLDVVLDFLSLKDPMHNFVKVRVYLLEQKGDYLESFKLNMKQLDNTVDIFKWIDTKFEVLSENVINLDKRLG